ncbi:MAG: Mur ligase family protein [Firmicutes bacterium]|nr:Mur ligase family protein [Bacillota bacterium]
MNILDAGSSHLYIVIAIAIINSAVLCFASVKLLQIVQLTGYSVRAYVAWVIKDNKAKYLSRLVFLSVLCGTVMFVVNVMVIAFEANLHFVYIGYAFNFALLIGFIVGMKVTPKKIPLRYTMRIVRNVSLQFLLGAVATFWLAMAGFWIGEWFMLILVGTMPTGLLLLVPLCLYILWPIEFCVNWVYAFKARHVLRTHDKLIKIAITGSYGKTSTKFILDSILREKYRVYSSPKSFNTPMGLVKTVNQMLKDSAKEEKVLESHKPVSEILKLKNPYDILICEMGAKRRGNIRELMYFIKPTVGILTAVSAQHLKTFKNIETIKKTKNELVENLVPGGFMVFNDGSKELAELYDACKHDKYRIKLLGKGDKKEKGFNIFAENVEVGSGGTSFDIVFGDEKVRCETKLLGEHNIENILMAAMTAKKLGLTMQEIAAGISKLEAVPHRMQLIKGEGGVVVIDNSYNSSIYTSAIALKVLKEMEGKKKVVVTPGIVELGNKLKYEENFKLGQNITKHADACIVVNKINRKALVAGLLDGGFVEGKNVYVVNTTEESKELLKTILKKGDVVLFENDLPDNYN